MGDKSLLFHSQPSQAFSSLFSCSHVGSVSQSRIQAVPSIPFFPSPVSMATDGGAGALAGVAATSGTRWPQRGQGEVKTPLDVPKSSAGWQPQPWHSGNPGLEQLSKGFPWDVSGTHGGSREQGKPLCSLGGQRRQENLDFLGGFH